AFPTTGGAFHRLRHAYATRAGKYGGTVVQAVRTDSAASVFHPGQSHSRIACVGSPQGRGCRGDNSFAPTPSTIPRSGRRNAGLPSFLVLYIWPLDFFRSLNRPH